MSLPSVEQFSLDLQTLHHIAHPDAAPDIYLAPVVKFFGKAYLTIPEIDKPNAGYELMLSTCQKALSEFEQALDPRLKADASRAAFTFVETIDFAKPYEAMVDPFSKKMDEFFALKMFKRERLYPLYYEPFNVPKPRFAEREPIYGDQFERRAFRIREKEFMEDVLRPWQDEKRRYEESHKSFEKSRSEYGEKFYGTPLYDANYLLPRYVEALLPLDIPQATRFQHQWVVANSGHGKTQLFQHMILNDLDAVARGQRSIVVIDSQNTLIPNIARLKLFAPGQPLEGRLTVLNPAENDLALNLFNLNFRDKRDPRQKQAVMNATLEMYSFMLGSLLERPMTAKQKTLFEYVALFLFHTPGATIRTFRDLMRKGSLERYRQHLDGLPPNSALKEFLEHDFSSTEYAGTKEEVAGRIATLLLNPTFDLMFGQPENKFDMLSEIGGGRVVLVNTSQHLLKNDGVKFFGRFMLAMIANAVAERGDIPEKQKLPTFVYLDEAYEYIKDDPNIVTILAQARKQNVGIIAAQQWLGQLNENVYDAFAAIASTIFAGGVSQSDAYKLAPMMRLDDPAFITGQSALSFAAYVKGVTKSGAVTVPIEYGRLEAMPVMSDFELGQQRTFMQFRYGQATGNFDLRWEITISPKLARDGGETREHGLIITIPAGLQHGTVLRLKNKGRMKPDKTYGHVFLKVNVPQLQQRTEPLPPPPKGKGSSGKSDKAW